MNQAGDNKEVFFFVVCVYLAQLNVDQLDFVAITYIALRDASNFEAFNYVFQPMHFINVGISEGISCLLKTALPHLFAISYLFWDTVQQIRLLIYKRPWKAPPFPMN